MKKLIVLAIALLLATTASSQVKKPTIMVVPSDVWCIQNGYTSTFDFDGATTTIPNHKLALQSNSDLLMAISKINTLMADRGFPLKDLNATIKAVERQNIENETLGIIESPIDRIYRTARADIILQLTWTVNTLGPKKSVTYNLQGIDSYTNKQVAGAQGTGAPSFSAEMATLLEEAVMVNMDSFCEQLIAHFDDISKNGHEVCVDIKLSEESGINLEEDLKGMELAEIIDNWMDEHTVNQSFSKMYSSENLIIYEQVRTTSDADKLMRQLRDYLRKNYDIQSKVMSQGLGRGILIINS